MTDFGTPDLVDLPAQTVAVAHAETELGKVPMVLPSLYDVVYGAFHDQGLRATEPEQAYYLFEDGVLHVYAAVPAPDGFVETDDVTFFERPAETTLRLRVVGPYHQIPAAFQALFNEAEEREVEVTSSRELYHGWSPYPQERKVDVHIGIRVPTSAPEGENDV